MGAGFKYNSGDEVVTVLDYCLKQQAKRFKAKSTAVKGTFAKSKSAKVE